MKSPELWINIKTRLKTFERSAMRTTIQFPTFAHFVVATLGVLVEFSLLALSLTFFVIIVSEQIWLQILFMLFGILIAIPLIVALSIWLFRWYLICIKVFCDNPSKAEIYLNSLLQKMVDQ